MAFFDLLEARVAKVDSLLCVGLDPHAAQVSAFGGKLPWEQVHYRSVKHDAVSRAVRNSLLDPMSRDVSFNNSFRSPQQRPHCSFARG